MGLFGNNYNRPGPGVPKDAPKKKGFARFFEIVGRDMGDLFKLNVIVAALLVPMIICVIFMGASWPYLGLILVGFVLYMAASVLFGPTIAAAQLVLTHRLRDEPCYMWHTFKHGFKSNFKQALPLGMLFSAIFALEGFAGALFLMGAAGKVNVFVVAMFIFSVFLVLIVSEFSFLQVIYLDLKNFAILKNSLLLTFGMAKRSLPAGIWLLVCTVGMLILAPPFAILLLFAFAVVLILLVADMWLWPCMESTFHISELLAAKRDGTESPIAEPAKQISQAEPEAAVSENSVGEGISDEE
ncbi:MAG: DUF624 domain-containing protein [Oscillospiraceae bacterium]